MEMTGRVGICSLLVTSRRGNIGVGSLLVTLTGKTIPSDLLISVCAGLGLFSVHGELTQTYSSFIIS